MDKNRVLKSWITHTWSAEQHTHTVQECSVCLGAFGDWMRRHILCVLCAKIHDAPWSSVYTTSWICTTHVMRSNSNMPTTWYCCLFCLAGQQQTNNNNNCHKRNTKNYVHNRQRNDIRLTTTRSDALTGTNQRGHHNFACVCNNKQDFCANKRIVVIIFRFAMQRWGKRPF